jgi:nicotinamide-nucleotide adenylyltransferase
MTSNSNLNPVPESSRQSEKLAATFKNALTAFHKSNSKFRVVHQVRTGTQLPLSNLLPPPSSPSRLIVLDSSFNPPTLAHAYLAREALSHAIRSASASSVPGSETKWPIAGSSSTVSESSDGPTRQLQSPPLPPPVAAAQGDEEKEKEENKDARNEGEIRLLLLLATTNADKAPKPASFPDRLAMMTLFAEDILQTFSPLPSSPQSTSSTSPTNPPIAVDIGVTTEPYFIDKTRAIDSSSSAYSSHPAQTHLTGYDTLLRILDPKYYPAATGLSVLAPLFKSHTLEVTLRSGDSWGGRAQQVAFLEKLQNGGFDVPGWRPEWASRIRVVEGTNKDGREIVSSTRARKAAAERDWEALQSLCSESVARYVRDMALYD